MVTHNSREEVSVLSPRTGRPTDEPKPHNMRIRMSDADVIKLDYCCEVLGLTKADVIRQGIGKMYTKAQKRAQK